MKKVVIGLGVAFLVVFALCVGLQISGGTRTNSTFIEDEGPTGHAASIAPSPSIRPNTIREGTWEVGKDVKPGKYKTSGAVKSAVPLCYWHVTVDGQIMAQGVKDQVGAQGIVTLAKGEVFETNGCEPWILDNAKPVSWTTPQTTPVSKRKVYVIETLPSSWPVASAQNFVDRYTGSNWVMSKTCPASAYRCIFVKPGNLAAPRLAETRNYSSTRVTIVVDLAYANPRAKGTTAKRWVLAHEFGHAAGLREHAGSCRNFMHATTRCMGWAVNASQKATMSRR